MIIKVKVIPKAKVNKVIRKDDQYRIHTAFPPDKGKANQAVIKLLSKELAIPKSKISIIKGKKSREKIIEIS
ncbi:hypothetical protein A3B87_02185 [Candidatus Kuenenbacteria bacterium RIFCSPHIGHO2_02_FULL_39_13]|uniref:UPF0235 protein A3B87_02185 n=1 Tax=Candidatus Kuenenbacteria bacterium RIFCSPHIGHO2_02_FULL_39_13 TaxID=1798561 RepID=A0A1F6FMI0_9BACT|nr:MAG: hypothetical protein A3B87_02185 [Candidatus Kuenenbacteria bacterium RIFCSPHIGHO2_02_FULL_39_13]